jgi:RNase adapter protein RapZ
MMTTGSGKEGLRSATGGIRASVLLVSGMSGAGRSTTLKILEDMGYEAFDKLPLPLVPALIESVPRTLRP